MKTIQEFSCSKVIDEEKGTTCGKTVTFLQSSTIVSKMKKQKTVEIKTPAMLTCPDGHSNWYDIIVELDNKMISPHIVAKIHETIDIKI